VEEMEVSRGKGKYRETKENVGRYSEDGFLVNRCG